MGFYGYQIWKPTSEDTRKDLIKQMEINNRFINQPLPENYKIFSEEILNTKENYTLVKACPGFGTTIWDMAKNYRAFKGEDSFELGDVLVIYHTNEDGRKYAPCFLVIGEYFYGWNKHNNKLLRDCDSVQQAWAKASNTELY